jgi:uncharacterized protein with NAD-binding domain and iron-sulfur cluster
MTTNTTTGKKKVIILGGGVAGLSAAHHLLTKGKGRFEVEIYERLTGGGKARSDYKKDDKGHPDKAFPTEHGFRFFPGFYKHITKTMKEIELEGGGNVYDNNLVSTKYYTFLFANKPGRLDVRLNIGALVSKFQFSKVLQLQKALHAQMQNAGIEIKQAGLEKLTECMLEVYTSCNTRIDSTYDNIAWHDFIDAGAPPEKYGKDYENLLATGISKNLVAVRADVANARTGAKLIGHMLWHIVAPWAPPADKILNAPTDVAWIQPWKTFLMKKGLIIHTDQRVVSLEFEPDSKQITGIRYDKYITAHQQPWDYYNDDNIRNALNIATADYFICAMPIERISEILYRSFHKDEQTQKNRRIKKYDRSLAKFRTLWKKTEWMTGIMLYFDTDIPISYGHITIADEPAAVTLISQLQFWKEYLKKNKLIDKQGREIKAVLSLVVSNWDAPSKYIYNKGVKLKNLSRDEVIDEVKEILFHCEIKPGVTLDAYRNNLLDEFLDDSITPYNQTLANPRFKPIEEERTGKPYALYNKEPLFINQVRTYHLRPTGYTGFENFFLASDYVKSNADLGCMDSADEAARRAVNNVFRNEKLHTPCEIDLYNLPSFFGLFGTARIMDYRDFKRGLKYNKNNPVRKVITWFFKKTFKMYTYESKIVIRVILFAGLSFLFLLVVVINFITRFFLKMIYVRSI